MKAIFLALLVLGSAALSGCQKTPYNPYAPSERPLDENRARIEQGRYSEAIDSLNGHLRQFPNDEEARLLLASAFAGRAGIKLRDFSNFARLILSNGAGSPRANGVDDASAQLEWEIGFVFTLMNSIPEPINGNAGIADITAAVDVLNGQSLSPGRYLYRAVLKLVIFKYNFDHKYHLKIYSPCQVRPKSLRKWFTQVELDLQDLISDVLLSRTDAEEKQKLQTFKIQLAEASEGIKSGLDDYMSDPLVKLPRILKKAYPECH